MVLQLRQSILLLTVKIQGCDRAVLFLRDSLGVLVLVFILGAIWMTMELVQAKVFLLVQLWTCVPRSVLHHTVVASCQGNRLPRPVARFCAWRSPAETAVLEGVKIPIQMTTYSTNVLKCPPPPPPPRHPTSPHPSPCPCALQSSHPNSPS